LDRRAIIAAAAPAGWAIGSAIWLLVAPAPGADQFARLTERITTLRVGRDATSRPPETFLTQLLATPLFAMTTGPNAVSEVLLKLDGLVRSPGRVAALLSINGAPSDWLELGQTRDGVTLQDVSSSKVVVDTATGLRDVVLGEPAPSVDAAPPSVSGLKYPPPPASAPGQPR